MQPVRSRFRLSFWILMLAFCTLAIAEAALPPPTEIAGTVPTGWRVIWHSDPATTATISWNTAVPGKSHRVYFDTVSHKGDVAKYGGHVDCQRNGRYSGTDADIPDLSYHHAHLTGLAPATRYYFVMVSDDAVSRELNFETAPVDDRPLQILFGGDSRSDQSARRQVNQLIAGMVATEPKLIAFAHGGDYIAIGTSRPQWTEWMSDHELTTAPSGRVLPIIAARGNHDRGPLFNEVFAFPEDDANYYAMDIGKTCRFLTLNTETSTAGDQRDWLAAELPKAREKRWVIVQYHRPAWPAVKGPSTARQHWVPLFEQYNVDLVCEADGHNIKRTPPIRNEKLDASGVVYIGEGGLGVGQRTPKIDERWYLQAPGKAGRGHHVHLLDLTDTGLRIRAVLLDEQAIFDDHTLKPREN